MEGVGGAGWWGEGCVCVDCNRSILAASIIYRDLKPENVLFQNNGHVALTDFDLSCLTSCKPQLLIPEMSEKKSHQKNQHARIFMAEPMRASNSFVVKGGHVTHLQLAEEWIVRSCQILEYPYSRHAYSSALEEAKQFLWAGPEMDVVRDIQSNLIQAKRWPKAVRKCLSKLKSWSDNGGDPERVQADHINELLRLALRLAMNRATSS